MGERGISSVTGVILLVGIAVLLIVVAGYAVVGVSENALGTAAVHSQSNYDVHIENEKNKQLTMDLRGFQDRAPDTEFVLSINDREIRRWQGRGDDDIGIECLYPGDEVQLISANGDTTVLLEQFQVRQPTACARYNSFENKFPNAVVDGNSYQIRNGYDFGLAINPNGAGNVAKNRPSDKRYIGNISLQNDWHHIEVYEDRAIGGLEPPVFLIVMVDNVHYNNVPVGYSGTYNWTDSPPAGLDPGSKSFRLEDGSVKPVNEDTTPSRNTEPTNDIYIVFQPGCEKSTVKFVTESAGFDNQIYKDDTLVIPNTNDATDGETFSAPGTDCPNGGEWR